MTPAPSLTARVALFAALVYVLSWGTSYLPNVNFIFFIVFSAGFLWGVSSGITVGAVGMALWTLFNPYGPAALPIMVAQVAGAAMSGIVGGVFRRAGWTELSAYRLTVKLLLAAITCTLLFYVPVSAADAWLFGPFWPRFIGGMIWALISLAANVVIFPLLFNATRYLYDRGWALH
jgi:hypothetical protein